jgi:hypothetical protein
MPSMKLYFDRGTFAGADAGKTNHNLRHSVEDLVGPDGLRPGRQDPYVTACP